MTAILSAICHEPEGPVLRHVYKMPLTAENLGAFWDRAKNFRTIFTADVNGDFKRFCETFISDDGYDVRAHGLFWVVDDFVGVYYMTHITEIDANVHYTFFDRRQRGRADLTRAMLKYAFDKYGFWRLSVQIPMYASKHTFGFVRSLGFKEEGRKRKAVEYDGQRFDVMLLGILREEIL